jgi:hypothetical protein
MKAYHGVDVQSHIFMTLALVEGEWPASHLGRFRPGERGPGTHSVGGWVDPRADLDNVEKRKILTLPGLELRPLGHPAHSQSLTRIRYPDSHNNNNNNNNNNNLCNMKVCFISSICRFLFLIQTGT